MAILVFIGRNPDQAKPANGFGRITCAVVAAALLLISTYGPAIVHAQDISGGAGESVKRPSESTTKRRPKTTPQPKSTKRATKTSASAAQAKAEQSKQVDAALELGNSARDSNPPRFADAEQAYKLAMGLDPEDARAYIGLGNTYFDQKRFPEAEAAFVRAAQLDPQDADALIALAYTNNAQERYDDAERAAMRAIAINGSAPTAFVALGWSKYRRKNYQEAEAAYRRAIALSPKTPEIYSELSAVLMAQGRWHDSEPVLLQAITLDPSNSAATVDYAFVLHKLGQLDKASATYAQAIKLDSKSTAPHSNLALIHYTRGDFAKARQEWEAALRLNSTYALDHVGLLILDRKFADAQMALDKYTQSNTADEDGWLLLGDVRRMQRDQPGAAVAYARASQIAPGYAQHVRPTIPEPAVAKPSPPPVVIAEKKPTPVATAKPEEKSPMVATSQPSGSATEPKLRYASSVRTVRATNNARTTSASGAISITSNPNATVIIEPLGGGEALLSVVPTSVTVVAFGQLRPGEYFVSASLDGYETLETRVFVAVTRTVTIKLIMRPKT